MCVSPLVFDSVDIFYVAIVHDFYYVCFVVRQIAQLEEEALVVAKANEEKIAEVEAKRPKKQQRRRRKKSGNRSGSRK